MHVAVAREQLRLATEPGGDAIELHVTHAQSEAGIATDAYQRALKAVEADPSLYNDLQIKNFALEAEVAKLRLAVWANPGTNTLSLLDHMHWQIQRVSEELLDLQQRVDKFDLVNNKAP